MLLTLLSLSGCFTPEAFPLPVESLPFTNEHTSDYDDIILQPFSYEGLTCPDGETATFYAVYRTGLTESAPIVLVFHAGAFDYVPVPQAEDPLAGDHFQGDSRLSAAWANDKVFETFGLLPGDPVDTSEVNTGSLPAALAMQGAFALYPANCWGDLWHNESGYTPNSPDDAFSRNGRFLAWSLTKIASPDSATAVAWREDHSLADLPIDIDATGIYLVGLGEGGRAVIELLRRVDDTGEALPPIKGILLDSTMDDLSPLVEDATIIRGYGQGLQRLYPSDYTELSSYSLTSWIGENGWSTPLRYIYSGADPELPDDTITNLLALAASYPDTITVTNRSESGHIFLNNDLSLAREAVGNMILE